MLQPLFNSQIRLHFGQIYNSTFHTPFNKYPIQIPNIHTPHFYITKNEKIFYTSIIFNSYVTDEEENFCKLYSTDSKLTVTKERLKKNVLYVFKIVSENEHIRTCELYKFDEFYVGFKTQARVIRKELHSLKEVTRKTKTQNKENVNKKVAVRDKKKMYVKYYVKVKNIECELMPMREYKDGETINVLMVEKCNDKTVFRDTKIPSGFIDVEVEKETPQYFMCRGKHFRGILLKKSIDREIKIRQKLKVKVLAENNFKFIFTLNNIDIDHPEKKYTHVSYVPQTQENTTLYDMNTQKNDTFTVRHNAEVDADFDFKENQVYTAYIKNTHPIFGTFVVINGFIGIMKKSESSTDYVPNIEEYFVGKSDVKGIVYNIVPENKTFMFSIRKYEEKFGVKKDEIKGTKSDDDKMVKKIRVSDDDLQIKLKNIIENSNDNIFKNELVKANREAFKQILIQNLEVDKYNLLFLDYCIQYESNIYDAIKNNLETEEAFRLLTNNLEKIKLSTEVSFLIYSLYYRKYPNIDSYVKILSFSIKNNKEIESLIDNERLETFVDVIYKTAKKDARTRIEKVISNYKKIWHPYIKAESNNIEYCRGLYRRVVDEEWKYEEVKGWYKRWLEFEKLNKGNEDEVKEKAKKFVSSYQGAK